MEGVLDLLRGSVRVELDGKYAERAVNICARNHVDFRDLVRAPGGETRMTVSLPGYIKLREVARESGAFTVRIVRRRGAPFFLWRLRRRYALIAGLLLCLFLVGLSSLYVWQIDVVGNETVSSSRILAALREEGVDIGTCILDISNKWISNSMLLRIPELSFITLNTHGSRIEVVVREEIPRPELIDPDAAVSVVAGKAGVITLMEVDEGWAVRAPGDTVIPGDELVSPYVPLGTGRMTHARARVWARTWYELTMKMPLETVRKTYTGREKTRFSVILGGKRINFYFSGGNPYSECDKMTSYRRLKLPGGAMLPVTVVRDRFEEFTTRSDVLTREAAGAILSARLLAELEEQIGDGHIVYTDYTEDLTDGMLTVTLTAECVEQIAAERALTDGEAARLRDAPAGQP